MLCSTQVPALAQQSLGVMWDPPASESQALAELRQFQKLGISVLELQTLPSDRLWTAVNKQGMTVYGRLGISFPTTSTFEHPDSTFNSALQKKAEGFGTHPSVKAIQLFEFGAIQQPEFRNQANLFFNRHDSLNSLRSYYLDNRLIEQQSELSTDFLIYNIALTPNNILALDIPAEDVIGGYRYQPSEGLQYLLTPLKHVVQQLRSHPDKPLFFEGSWLLTMVKKHPQLPEILQSLSSEEDFLFPVPVENLPNPHQPYLAIVILLLVWATLGYHYHMSPLYRKSLFRYFTGHTFFVNDIFRRHIRSPIPALVILGQHALLISAALFAVFDRLCSPLGLQALAAHFPTFFFSGAESYIVFIIGLASIILFSLLSILWLYFSHKTVLSVTQFMTLFAWPLQLNFLFATIIIALYVAEGSIHTMLIFTALMVLVITLSFLVTAWDASESLSTKKIKYLGVTAGLYSAVIITIIIWGIGFNPPFWEIINLSLQLK